MTQSYVSFVNLSGETLTLNNSVIPTLSSQYWEPSYPITVPSSRTPVQALVFSREEGITDGDTWYLSTNFEVDGVNVQFEVELRGADLGLSSEMQQCLNAGNDTTGWWSSNDGQSLLITGQSGTKYTVQVSPIVRFPLVAYADFIMTVSKNTLMQEQQLNLGDQLNSPGGLLNVTLEESGLVLYRSMFNYPLWSSPNPDSLVANTAVMQADGNFVVYDANNNPIWATGTNDILYLMLNDNGFNGYNGNAVSPIAWSPDFLVPNWTADTFQYNENGYAFDETSEYWKQMCQNLPCSTVLAWPDYSTTTFDAVIDGQAVVIQAWRGYCEQFLGSSSFPGGIGAEVGVYTKQPALSDPSSDSWYPLPYVVASVSFQLINPDNGGSLFFESSGENTYWNCKWMTPESYTDYQNAVGPGNYPLLSDRYQMKIQVIGNDGTSFETTWEGEQ